jgi:hypothetical protein
MLMQPLDTQFEDRTFRYAQVERQGNVAIFTQTHKQGGAVRYEVVRVRIQAAHTWPTGITSPEREAYPGSASWGGREAHTCFTLPEAQAIAQQFQQLGSATQEAELQDAPAEEGEP